MELCIILFQLWAFKKIIIWVTKGYCSPWTCLSEVLASLQVAVILLKGWKTIFLKYIQSFVVLIMLMEREGFNMLIYSQHTQQDTNVSSQDKSDHSKQVCDDLQWPFPLRETVVNNLSKNHNGFRFLHYSRQRFKLVFCVLSRLNDPPKTLMHYLTLNKLYMLS